MDTPAAPKKPRVHASTALAATLELTSSELREYQYQPGRYSRAIYSIGNESFAVGKTKPKDDLGGEWKKWPDQHWAQLAGTVVWFCKAE